MSVNVKPTVSSIRVEIQDTLGTPANKRRVLFAYPDLTPDDICARLGCSTDSKNSVANVVGAAMRLYSTMTRTMVGLVDQNACRLSIYSQQKNCEHALELQNNNSQISQ